MNLLRMSTLRSVWLAFFTIACSHLRGDFSSFSLPTQAYVQQTSLIDFTLPDYWATSSISDGIETLAYDTPLSIRTVSNGWATWNSPPAVEISKPRLGATGNQSSLWITLGAPVHTFGFELEPDNFASEQIAAYFFSANALLGTVQLSPSGYHGALLFAGSATSDPISSVYIDDISDAGFAIARQRYSFSAVEPAPEPSSCAMSLVAFSLALIIIVHSRCSKA